MIDATGNKIALLSAATARPLGLLLPKHQDRPTITTLSTKGRILSLHKMRLLHTKLLEFEEFFDSQIPRYAILSHRWAKKEVTFQDFGLGRQQVWPGFVKIRGCCAVALSQGFDWVWIDTCCIDKKSSAELSEAINSMWRWYREAKECYVYLSDVQWKKGMDLQNTLKQSSWFTRGWTLQELLAPSQVVFFDREWNYIGVKQKMLAEISAVTGIGAEHLNNISGASVATKMSWVSRRQTSRLEDMAYCLLGIFGINMPLLYGEGRKAFLRLELEILKKSDDESIFAWISTSKQPHDGLLALWPDSFADSSDISVFTPAYSSVPQSGAPSGLVFLNRHPYSMTNKGLEFTVPRRDLPMIRLHCRRSYHDNGCALSIKLQQFGHNWRRINCDRLYLSDMDGVTLSQLSSSEKQTIYSRQETW